MIYKIENNQKILVADVTPENRTLTESGTTSLTANTWRQLPESGNFRFSDNYSVHFYDATGNELFFPIRNKTLTSIQFGGPGVPALSGIRYVFNGK